MLGLTMEVDGRCISRKTLGAFLWCVNGDGFVVCWMVTACGASDGDGFGLGCILVDESRLLGRRVFIV